MASNPNNVCDPRPFISFQTGGPVRTITIVYLRPLAPLVCKAVISRRALCLVKTGDSSFAR